MLLKTRREKAQKWKLHFAPVSCILKFPQYLFSTLFFLYLSSSVLSFRLSIFYFYHLATSQFSLQRSMYAFRLFHVFFYVAEFIECNWLAPAHWKMYTATPPSEQHHEVILEMRKRCWGASYLIQLQKLIRSRLKKEETRKKILTAEFVKCFKS